MAGMGGSQAKGGGWRPGPRHRHLATFVGTSPTGRRERASIFEQARATRPAHAGARRCDELPSVAPSARLRCNWRPPAPAGRRLAAQDSTQRAPAAALHGRRAGARHRPVGQAEGLHSGRSCPDITLGGWGGGVSSVWRVGAQQPSTWDWAARARPVRAGSRSQATLLQSRAGKKQQIHWGRTSSGGGGPLPRLPWSGPPSCLGPWALLGPAGPWEHQAP